MTVIFLIVCARGYFVYQQKPTPAEPEIAHPPHCQKHREWRSMFPQEIQHVRLRAANKWFISGCLACWFVDISTHIPGVWPAQLVVRHWELLQCLPRVLILIYRALLLSYSIYTIVTWTVENETSIVLFIHIIFRPIYLQGQCSSTHDWHWVLAPVDLLAGYRLAAAYGCRACYVTGRVSYRSESKSECYSVLILPADQRSHAALVEY